jgi:hypothetical protein
MKEKAQGYAMTSICSACPWRKDVPVGVFPPERFIALAATVKQDFGPVFACHKTTEGQDSACVGYLLTEGTENFNVRIASIRGALDMKKLKSEYPLYATFKEMALANGVAPEDLP